jgi:acyl-CoA thioesterase I
MNKGNGEKSSTGEAKQTGPVVYVALGDSTGAGVGARQGGGYVERVFERITRERPGSCLVNLCVSRATTADVLRGQVGRVGAERPTLVTLGIGINDLTHGVAPDEFARNYEEIVKRLRREAPDAPLVVSNIPDISFAPRVPIFLQADLRRRIQEFNVHIAALADAHGLRLVDAYEFSHEVIPKHPEFFSEDGFHPSAEGYEFWAVKMWPAVKEALGSQQ